MDNIVFLRERIAVQLSLKK